MTAFVFFPFIKTLSNVLLAKFKQLHRFSLCIATSLSTSRFPGLSTVGVRVSRGLSGLRRAEGQVLGDQVTWLNRVEFAFRASSVPTLKPFAQLVLFTHRQNPWRPRLLPPTL